MARLIATILERVRAEQPLVHIITNFVTMNDVANDVLAIGARPVMGHAVDEVAEIASNARALVLNLGTPSPERVEAMLMAGKAANARSIPIIFDPVGVGASAFRRDSAARLLDSLKISIMRGNASEIGMLAGTANTMSGVDSVNVEFDRAKTARALAQKYRCVIAVTGEKDFVIDDKRAITIANGHPWLKQIAGAGDMVSAISGACAAVEKDMLIAAACGLTWFGIAAERAADRTSGIGSFRVALFDELHSMKIEKSNIRIEEAK